MSMPIFRVHAFSISVCLLENGTLNWALALSMFREKVLTITRFLVSLGDRFNRHLVTNMVYRDAGDYTLTTVSLRFAF
ncbi:hypothetical protein AC626_22200 [Pseudoalteromonas rubra]|uniref:Uncharacterized protein n=1 Tax=Pseudoalteromonas rubra TaxID=43658 RepID=A0A0L0EMC7_9GAMM|nr:hypothetical protein AC626_22200 [Pseudoalteromonas rubra]